jgi:inhibitor of cysteine peptidase
MSSRSLSILLFVMLTTTSCTASKLASLTATDHGRTIEVPRGTEVLVSLESNRTTGYTWTLAGPMSGPLRQDGEPFYVQNPASTGAVGVGGIETWRFRAAAKGEQRLAFEYRRPFEQELTPARSVTIDVRVR